MAGRRRFVKSVRRLLAVLRAGGDLRRAKVRRVRAAVRAQRYENDLKFEVAVDRLLGELHSISEASPSRARSSIVGVW